MIPSKSYVEMQQHRPCSQNCLLFVLPGPSTTLQEYGKLLRQGVAQGYTSFLVMFGGTVVLSAFLQQRKIMLFSLSKNRKCNSLPHFSSRDPTNFFQQRCQSSVYAYPIAQSNTPMNMGWFWCKFYTGQQFLIFPQDTGLQSAQMWTPRFSHLAVAQIFFFDYHSDLRTLASGILKNNLPRK